MDFGKVSAHLLQYIPLVIATVRAAVEAVESPGNGPEKASGVLQIVEMTLRSTLPGSSTASDLAVLLGYARSLIPVVVGIYNLLGKFTSSTPAPAVVIPAPDPKAIRAGQIREEIVKLQGQIGKLDGGKDAKKIKTKTDRLEALKAELEGLG